MSPAPPASTATTATAATACHHCAAALRWRGGTARCAACGLWQSDLRPQLEDEAARALLDEAHRNDALKSLRQSNFARILDVLARLAGDRRGRLLDVGCAHGWFLEQARARGYEATGVEPDARLARIARDKGVRVLEGLFPQALPAGERFDAIVFNDVLEHLPDPALCLAQCLRLLEPGGLLVVNVPNAQGGLFQLARALRAVGLDGPWRRLWQVGFPSPHLFYFSPDNLRAMAERQGFKTCHEGPLEALDGNGLWDRLRMDTRTPWPVHAAQWLGLKLLQPCLRLRPSDIHLAVFRKP